MSLTGDILRSYRAPRAVLRDLGARDRREGRLLFYLMLACALMFVAQMPAALRPTGDAPSEGVLAGRLFALVFVAPLVFYGIGGGLGLVLGGLRRGVQGFDVRLALFWALLASAPLGLVQTAVALVAPGPLAGGLGLLVFAGFATIFGAGLRVALEATPAGA
jgi:hypothetical protein